jgi:hypothetical protein
MPTRKKAPQSKKGSTRAGKSSRKVSARTAVETGPVPPYGVAIREAIARGDAQEMRKLAASTRKWLSDVSSALDKLESSVKKSGA